MNVMKALRRVYKEAHADGDEGLVGPLFSFCYPETLQDDTVRGQLLLKFLERAGVLEVQLHSVLVSEEPAWVERVELALMHLNRTLGVDESIRQRWTKAWESQTEPALERLGGVHLLSHGLFGFKARAVGAETDLVLGQPLRRDDASRAGSPLVLTEWKKVDTEDAGDLQVKMAEAENQLRLYSANAAATLELRCTRYAVLVSRRALLAVPADRTVGAGVRIRVVNVVIEPQPISVQAHAIAVNAGP